MDHRGARLGALREAASLGKADAKGLGYAARSLTEPAINASHMDPFMAPVDGYRSSAINRGKACMGPRVAPS
jgi:hypothetical protein